MILICVRFDMFPEVWWATCFLLTRLPIQMGVPTNGTTYIMLPESLVKFWIPGSGYGLLSLPCGRIMML